MSCTSCTGTDSAAATSELGLRMLGKAMQQQKVEGRAMLQMIEAADVPPPAQEPGKGTQVDVTA